jgi:hypothetical protein
MFQLSISQDCYDYFSDIILPVSNFDNKQQQQQLVEYFVRLYNIDILKNGLDFILTKLHQRELSFEIKNINGWDTNIGCFLTEEVSFFDNIINKIAKKKTRKIIIRRLSYNVLAHEMAHAIEFISNNILAEDFRQAVDFDMKNREPKFIPLRSHYNRLMIEAIKLYKPQYFLSEVFARFFELLAISRDVVANGDFTTFDVIEFFPNIVNFLNKKFYPKIMSQIDSDIAKYSKIFIAKQQSANNSQYNQSKIKKFQSNITSNLNNGKVQWSKNNISNKFWQDSWDKNKKV